MRSEIIRNMPFADYHAAPEIGSSALKKIHTESPRAYHLRIDEETDAMRVGTAGHLAVGQPDLFEEGVVAYDGKRDKRVRAWQDFQEEHAHQTILKRADYDDIRRAADAVRAHPHAGPLLRSMVEWELSIFHDGLKVRLDGLGPCVLEIKTAASAAEALFAAQSARLGYPLQFAQYLDLAREKIDPGLDMMLIAFEKKSPYETAVYRIPDDVLDHGRKAYLEARETYDRCMETGHWPGAYDDGPLELRLPRWAEPEREELKRADYSGLGF